MLSAPFLVMKSYFGHRPLKLGTEKSPMWTIHLLNRLFENMEYFLMPTKHQNNKNTNGYREFEFANLRLSEPQKAHFKGWFSENAPSFEELIASYTLVGYKHSFSWDEKNDCFIASMTCNNQKSPNANCVLTSRSEDWFEALMMNVYKTAVICEDEVWPRQSNKDTWG